MSAADWRVEHAAVTLLGRDSRLKGVVVKRRDGKFAAHGPSEEIGAFATASDAVRAITTASVGGTATFLEESASRRDEAAAHDIGPGPHPGT
jgi:hypothetical protein